MRSLPHVVAAMFTQPWLIEPRKGQILAHVVTRRASGTRLTPVEVDDEIGEARAARTERIAAAGRVNSQRLGVAVVPVLGTLVHRGSADNSSGMSSLELVAARFRDAVADPNVGTIVLDVDSPGGEVAGTMELAAEIAASPKPVVAVANSTAASAAYWIASAADELVVTPSGEVGSIGVLILHLDDSKALEQEGLTRTVISAGEHKAEMWGPLTEDARVHLEGRAQHLYEQFVAAVATNRGVPPSRVRTDFGRGRMVLAQEAKAAGMVDRIATFDETIARLVAGGRVRRTRAEAPRIDDLALRERELELE